MQKPKTWLEVIQEQRKPMPPPTRVIPDKRKKKPKHKRRAEE